MNTTIDQTELLRAKYHKAYNSARSNSLWAIIFTFASMALLVVMGVSFYFSAYLPVTLMESGVIAKDLDTANYTDAELLEQGVADEAFAAYRDELAAAGDDTEYTDEELYEMGVADAAIAAFRADLAAYQEETDGNMEFMVGAVLSVIIAVFYLLCWLLSKKHPVWMIVLTVAYIIDTLIMIPDLFSYYLVYDTRGLIFLTLYHAWILYYLISGVIGGFKLKKLPAPAAPIEGEAVEISPEAETIAIPAEETAPTEESAPADSDNGSTEV